MSLFLVLFVWQLPHTFAIGIYRKPEYEAAGLRTLSLDHSDSTARLHILLSTVALVAATAWTVLIGVGGTLTAIGTAALGGIFMWKAVNGVRTSGDVVWSRDLFLYSVFYLLGIFILMAADHVL